MTRQHLALLGQQKKKWSFYSCEVCDKSVTIFIDDILVLLWVPFVFRSCPVTSCFLFAAAVHATVEAVCGGEAGHRQSGCDPRPELRTGTLHIFPVYPTVYNKPTQHRRLLPRLGLPVNLWSAGGARGQPLEQWDNRLGEDSASVESSVEPGTERCRRQRGL